MHVESWQFLLLCTLATYRVSALFARDDGPLDVFKVIRTQLEKWADWSSLARFFSDLLSCPRCNSVWFGAGFGLLWAYATGAGVVPGLVAGLAMSAVTIFLDDRIA